MVRHYCAIHDIREIADSETTICMECGHCYKSDQEIIDIYNSYPEFSSGRNLISDITSVDDISFCPLCLHDW